MGSSQRSILKTLLYSDIFDYPLSKEEIWKFLVSAKKEKKSDIEKELRKKNNYFAFRKGFYFIKGREILVEKRIEREKYSLEKISFAKKIIGNFKKIPTVDFLGISGALAMKNSGKDDDIDLFVITSKNSVWTTRLIMVIFLIITGNYRVRNDVDVSNKICLNMLIDETAAVFPKKRQNLYTAHEIVQIYPVLDRNSTYESFMKKNLWVKEFLPNFQESMLKPQLKLKSSPTESILKFLLSSLFVENIARMVQRYYMKNHITKEIVKDNFLAFHPLDYTHPVLKNFRGKVKKYPL